MKAAAAARGWWAAYRQRSHERVRTSVLDMTLAHRLPSALLGVAALTLLCALASLAITRRDDDHRAADRHVALRLALDELHAVFGDAVHFDAAQLRLIERRSGLRDVRFDDEPPPDVSREIQSLQNAQGRIVGWFSWVPDRALVRAMYWLWSLVGALALALAVFAVFAARATQRLAGLLARNVEATRRLTSEDAVTGLPNHRIMLANLNNVLGERGANVAFMLIDLDGFREVNDTLGQSGGDKMLGSIAERLKARLPPRALFGRFEDDEFAVILRGDDVRSAAALADSLRASLSPPIFMDQMWQISAGIGVARAPDDGTSGEDLVRRAGLALRAAKRDGRGMVRAFESRIETEYEERRFLLRELEIAVSLRALNVHYQPVVAADGTGMVGVEALLRWTHPILGPVAPSVFIPLAEQSGLMFQLGEIALRRALNDSARWPQLFIAVNLSPVQIRDNRFLDLIAAVMNETSIASSRVVLEITEGVLIEDLQETQIRLEALRALGLRIALDDFGTGYSSLSYLQKFPFDRLKIDRTFVASLGAGGNTGAIIQSIVTLGHALGMKVLGEGVETDEQRVLLRLAGCDEMQGYLFAKPGPAEEIDAALSRRPSQVPIAAGQRGTLR